MKALIFLIPFWTTAASADPGKFKEVLRSVGDENPRVLRAKAEALAQKSAQVAGLLSWTPTLTAQGSQVLAPAEAEGTEAVNVEARLNLIRFGGDVSRVREARNSRRQADVRILTSALDAESQAAELLFQWIELQWRLKSQKSYFESKKELNRVAEERFRLGQLPAQELEKVRLDATNSEIQIRQAEVDLLSLRSQLEAWLKGASSVQVWPWTERAKTAGGPRPKPVTERLRYESLRLETEIRGSKAWQSASDWLPRLDITSNWKTDQVEPLGRGEWSSFLTLTIPLWDQGQSAANRGYWLELRRAGEQELEIYRRDEAAKLATLDERVELLGRNLTLALNSRDRFRSLAGESLRRFRLGRTSVNDLLLDQSRVLDSENLAQQALRQFHAVLLERCLAADERPSDCY